MAPDHRGSDGHRSGTQSPNYYKPDTAPQPIYGQAAINCTPKYILFGPHNPERRVQGLRVAHAAVPSMGPAIPFSGLTCTWPAGPFTEQPTRTSGPVRHIPGQPHGNQCPCRER